MADELHDFRGKVTARTHQVLAALEHATGKTQSELAREVLDQWAADEIHKASLIQRLTRCEGSATESGGRP